MTNNQKIIKYFAISFGIYLAVMIFYAGFRACLLFLDVTGLVKLDSNTYTGITSLSNNEEEINSLTISLSGASLKITKGEKFEVKTDNSNVKYTNENGNVKVEERRKISILNAKNDVRVVEITIPEYMKEITNTNIEVGAGEVAIEYLNANNITFELGAGKATISGLNVSKEAEIKGGAGQVSITESIINNLTLKLGVGKTSINAKILGDNTIDTDVGKLDLTVDLPLDECRFKIDKGLGSITFNGENISDDYNFGNGQNIFDIKGGIGAISIKTN